MLYTPTTGRRALVEMMDRDIDIGSKLHRLCRLDARARRYTDQVYVCGRYQDVASHASEIWKDGLWWADGRRNSPRIYPDDLTMFQLCTITCSLCFYFRARALG